MEVNANNHGNSKHVSSHHANLRIDIKHNNHSSHSSSHSHSHQHGLGAPPISHATRIQQTNLTYTDLLRKHQFTPSGGSVSQSPMKQSFENFHLDDLQSHHPHSHDTQHQNEALSRLEAERERFRRKPIIEEPKKNVTGYQLFAKWKRTQNLQNGYHSQSKAISLAWSELSQSEKDEWNKKSEQAKIQYHHEKEQWLKYVEEAKRLVCILYIY